MVSCPTAQVSMRILPQSKAAQSGKKGFSHGVPQDCIPWRGPAGGEQGTPDPGQLRNRGLEPWGSGVVPGVLCRRASPSRAPVGTRALSSQPLPLSFWAQKACSPTSHAGQEVLCREDMGLHEGEHLCRGRPWGTPSPYILLVARFQCARGSNRGWCQYQRPRGRPKRPRAPGFSPASSSCPESEPVDGRRVCPLS